MTNLPHSFFLRIGAGQRFCLFHPPAGDVPRGRILYCHPFAEELNTTRRVVGMQARALAQAGFAVLQFDMAGCGDSSGEFGDADWTTWVADAQAANVWLGENAPGPLWLWGMRAGALVAAALLETISEPAHLLLWQPQSNGQQALRQFLRLQAASGWLAGQDKPGGEPAETVLDQGRAVVVAGYALNPALARGLASARLQVPADRPPMRLVWLEVTRQAPPGLSPASETNLAAWRAAGWQVEAQAVNGPTFWQTASFDEAPTLINATLLALQPTSPP